MSDTNSEVDDGYCDQCDREAVCRFCGSCIYCDGCKCCVACHKVPWMCESCYRCEQCGHLPKCEGSVSGPENDDPEPEVEKRIPDDETDGERMLRTGEVPEGMHARKIDFSVAIRFTPEELAEIFCMINRDRETVVVDRSLFELLLSGYCQEVLQTREYETAISRSFVERYR